MGKDGTFKKNLTPRLKSFTLKKMVLADKKH